MKENFRKCLDLTNTSDYGNQGRGEKNEKRKEGGSEKSKKSVRKEESQEIKKEERRVTDLFIKQFY